MLMVTTNLSKDWLNIKTFYVINYELLFMKRYEKMMRQGTKNSCKNISKLKTLKNYKSSVKKNVRNVMTH